MRPKRTRGTDVEKRMSVAARPERGIPPVSGVGFAVLEGNPIRFTDLEAWMYVQGQWTPVHPAVANWEANLLCAWAFRERLPPLPPHAFGGRKV